MNSDFKSEKIEKYNHIEKYDMKWISKNKINIMSVPVIPNRTRSFNSYSLSQIEMESDILDLDYNILDGKIDKNRVEEAFKEEKNKYSNESLSKWNKYTNVIEKNDVIGYAYSLNIINLNQIRIEYFLNVDNNISENEFYLYGILSFDSTNYDRAKPIIEELSSTLNFDFINLIDQVK